MSPREMLGINVNASKATEPLSAQHCESGGLQTIWHSSVRTAQDMTSIEMKMMGAATTKTMIRTNMEHPGKS